MRLGQTGLKKVRSVLSKHHSADKNFITGAMAMKKQPPWKCAVCKALNRYTKAECGKCWGPWARVMDPTYVHQPQHGQGSTTWDAQPNLDASWSWTQPGRGNTPKPGRKDRRDRSLSRKERELAKKDKASAKSQASWEPFEKLSTFQHGARSQPAAPKIKKNADNAGVDHGVSQEWIEAMREAYPDPSTMPPKTKALWDKVHGVSTKQRTSDMHRQASIVENATETLIQLQQSKKAHRAAWLAHLQETVEAWNRQNVQYQCQQREFNDLIGKTKETMDAAQARIDALNQRGAGAVKTEAVEEIKDDQDEEEEAARLREKVRQALNQSLDATKMDAVDLVSEEENEGRGKRARSSDAANGAM